MIYNEQENPKVKPSKMKLKINQAEQFPFKNLAFVFLFGQFYITLTFSMAFFHVFTSFKIKKKPPPMTLLKLIIVRC